MHPKGTDFCIRWVQDKTEAKHVGMEARGQEESCQKGYLDKQHRIHAAIGTI